MRSAEPERRTRGFTLIELLVVVAIIALLISILMPSLLWAKAQARQAYCLSNLRTIGDAAHLYGADNDDYVPRGIQIFTGDESSEYHTFVTAILKYLGGPYDGPEHNLWNQDIIDARTLLALLWETEKLQCPDWPEEDMRQGLYWKETSPLDYVSSAMPIPYTIENFAFDQGHLEWEPDGGYMGVYPESGTIYYGASRIESFPNTANPAAIVYVTESHVSLPWALGNRGRLHHFFLAQQLPFSERPRIANDQRHPGGINALFFDNHARPMDLHEMDPAYPHTLDIRLKWFTVMPDGWEEW